MRREMTRQVVREFECPKLLMRRSLVLVSLATTGGCSRMAKKRASGTLELEISGNHSSEPLLKQCKATAAGADILHQSRFYKKVGLKRQSSNMQIFQSNKQAASRTKLQVELTQNLTSRWLLSEIQSQIYPFTPLFLQSIIIQLYYTVASPNE